MYEAVAAAVNCVAHTVIYFVLKTKNLFDKKFNSILEGSKLVYFYCLGLHRGCRLDGYYGLAEVAGVCKRPSPPL